MLIILKIELHVVETQNATAVIDPLVHYTLPARHFCLIYCFLLCLGMRGSTYLWVYLSAGRSVPVCGSTSLWVGGCTCLWVGGRSLKTLSTWSQKSSDRKLEWLKHLIRTGFPLWSRHYRCGSDCPGKSLNLKKIYIYCVYHKNNICCLLPPCCKNLCMWRCIQQDVVINAYQQKHTFVPCLWS